MFSSDRIYCQEGIEVMAIEMLKHPLYIPEKTFGAFLHTYKHKVPAYIIID